MLGHFDAICVDTTHATNYRTLNGTVRSAFVLRSCVHLITVTRHNAGLFKAALVYS